MVRTEYASQRTSKNQKYETYVDAGMAEQRAREKAFEEHSGRQKQLFRHLRGFPGSNRTAGRRWYSSGNNSRH